MLFVNYTNPLGTYHFRKHWPCPTEKAPAPLHWRAFHRHLCGRPGGLGVKSLGTAPSWWQMESEGKITSFLTFRWEDSETCSSQCLNVSHWGWALLVHNTPSIAFPPFLVILPLSITHFSWYYVPNKLHACKSCFKYTSRGTQLKAWYVQNSVKNEN